MSIRVLAVIVAILLVLGSLLTGCSSPKSQKDAIPSISGDQSQSGSKNSDAAESGSEVQETDEQAGTEEDPGGDEDEDSDEEGDSDSDEDGDADEGDDPDEDDDMGDNEDTDDEDDSDTGSSSGGNMFEGVSGTQNSAGNDSGTAVSTKGYDLESYTLPGVFSMKKPKGWKVYKAGEYNTLAFLARDEKEPLRQIFCFSEIGLFYIDKNQKDLENNYTDNNGYPVPWRDMPVVSPFDGTTFFKNFHAIMKSKIATGFLSAGRMPRPAGFEKIQVISQTPMDPVIMDLPAVLVRAVLVQNGKPAQGMFIVSGAPDGFGHATAVLVTGITAPAREYRAVQQSLLQSIRSFRMNDSYVADGVQTIQENGERFRQISKTLSETSDIITKGWAERNKSDDILIEKRGDQIMGVERVYDPETDEVYEVQNGFYDYYQTHQDQYKLKNLQPLPPNDTKLWETAPRLSHGLVVQ